MIKGKLCIDVGCGEACQPEFIGMDKRDLEGVDIVHDVEVFPWPIEDDSVHVLMMSHIVEHIKPWLQIDFINEAWRVLKPKGMLLISTPYGGSFRYNQDPTHCSPWNEATPTYFEKGSGLYEIYKPKPWKLQRCNYYVHGDLEIVFVKEGENGDSDKAGKE